jgi:hypothetical protein
MLFVLEQDIIFQTDELTSKIIPHAPPYNTLYVAPSTKPT